MDTNENGQPHIPIADSPDGVTLQTKNPDELIRYLIQGGPRLSQQAAWRLNDLLANGPILKEKHLSTLLKILAVPTAPDPLKRNILKLLVLTGPIPKKHHGTLLDCCLKFIENPTTKTAAAAYSFKILPWLCQYYPAILPHIKTVIEIRTVTASAGFRAAAKNFLMTITKNSKRGKPG